MAVQLLRRSFTIEEYHRMGEAGILREDDRVELIDGEIVQMTPIGSRHAACVMRLNQVLSRHPGQGVLVNVQNPIRLGEYSELQPDVTLLRFRPDFYAKSHPGPTDVLLVMEVAETSAAYDREVKALLYAKAAIPEVWLVDLAEERTEVYRQPSPRGYRDVRMIRRGELLTPLVLPELALAVNDVLGS